MEYITKSEAKSALGKGYSGELLSLDIEQCHVMLNAWCGIVDELAPRLVSEFRYYLLRVGIHRAIDESKAELDNLRSSRVTGTGVFHALVLELEGDTKKCTIALGFPVRFTLSENPSLEAETVNTFLRTDSEVRSYDTYGSVWEGHECDLDPASGYKPTPQWFLRELSEVGHAILKGWEAEYQDTWWKVPTGATYECASDASPAKKLLAATKLGFDLDGMLPLPVDAVDFNNSCIVRSERPWKASTYVPFRQNVSRLLTVPKNYKALRTIAEEETFRQLHLGRLGDSIMRCYDHYKGRIASPVGRVKFRDQSRNQELARKGSITGELATIDFSHASDSISSTIACAVLPWSLYTKILVYRANRIEVPVKKKSGNARYVRHLNMFSTMGSRVTFPLETHIFWCIAMVTRKFAKRWFGIDTNLDDYSVYGDDVIVPASVAELFMLFARLAGFSPNMEKSFWEGHYRESCGEEFYNGISARGLYWPRAVVDLSQVTGLQSMLGLQHRLVSNFPKTARVLAELLISRYPNLTYNEIGTDADCIWSAFPPLLKKSWTLQGVSVEAVKVSRAHTYVVPTQGVTQAEQRCAEALAYAWALKGVRQFDGPLEELLQCPAEFDHRVLTHKIESSIRARYEKI